MVPKAEYVELRKAQVKLNMLEAGGVDNWDWFGDSLNPDGEESYSEYCDNLDKEYGL